MDHLAAGTVVSKNYLSFARVLADSFRRVHPEVPLFVLLADQPDGCFDPRQEAFQILNLEEVGIPDLPRLRFRYDRQQVVVGAKPFLLSHLLNLGFPSAVFLDADILILNRLEPLFQRVLQHDLVLTPHVLEPCSGKDRIESELNLLHSGIYNGGFVGVSGRPAAKRFLGWWQERLLYHCRHSVTEGMHYDQRWLDFAPAFVEDLDIVRDPGCNVAYWNLRQRDLNIQDGSVSVEGQPCRFFHFSGFTPERPEQVTCYWPRVTMADIGPAAELFHRYAALLENAGYQTTLCWPYSYNCFDNGVEIPAVARRIYSDLGTDAARFGDPRETGRPDCYFGWLNEAVLGEPCDGRRVTRLWRLIYEARSDVKEAYPDIAEADRDGFLEWTRQSGLREHGIPGEFLPRHSSPEED